MSQNLLKLNTDKTEVIIFGNKEHRLKTAALLGTKGFKLPDIVKNLGVTIDSDLSFSSHMKAITKSAFYHLKKKSKDKKLNITRWPRKANSCIYHQQGELLQWSFHWPPPKSNQTSPNDSKYSCEVTDQNQKKRSYYTRFKIPTLATCDLQNRF